jgi:arginine-tRNA-protein transferase
MSTSAETLDLVQSLGKTIEQIGLEPGEGRDCAYLPGQQAREIAFKYPRQIPGLYHSLMDLNFRRTGHVIYRPACEGCSQCRAIRIPVNEFQPNRSQRRCWKRNSDIRVELSSPSPDREKHALYQRYLDERHEGQMDDSWEALSRFLYDSPLCSVEMVYRVEDRLVGVGIMDVEPRAASTVYFYFDPAEAQRSLGTLNILCAIEWCRQQNLDYVYLGYYVADCRQMNYKTNFRPCEILQPDEQWERLGR